MPSDQRKSQYERANGRALGRGESGQIAARDGEVMGSGTVDSLNTTTYTEDTEITFKGDRLRAVFLKTDGAWVDDALMILSYEDQNFALQTWSLPSTIIEDCEDDWDRSGWTTAGPAGLAVVENAVEGTNSIKTNKDPSTEVNDFVFEAFAAKDLSEMTYIAFWAQTGFALAAGDYSIGVATSNDYTTGIREVALPAIAAGAQKLIIIALKGVAGILSVGLTVKSLPGPNGTIFIDQIRALTDREKVEMTRNLIVDGTPSGTEQALEQDLNDRISRVTDVSCLGGASGSFEIRGR